ncbi:hypothetical protein Ccrd_019039 [Cynara cardunculus var. scolymus]|uniref:Uncharacterized protein n=1 Tax=Cynara cardunculus var. scolymus TaxID=59895 RepID=A0A124SFA8_CYNCS|nr:hypothetical protein Ccrd_019039 [Cynara cardunculus var. scolymus]
MAHTPPNPSKTTIESWLQPPPPTRGAEDFRPTAPGHSPGVSFTAKKSGRTPSGIGGIACHAILLAEGRQLKPLKNKDKKDTETQTKHALDPLQKHLRNENSFQVSSAGEVPTITSPPVTEKEAKFPPQVPTQTQGDGISDLKAITAFRPTTPGNSPGAGHSFTEHRLDFESEASSNVNGIPQSNAESGNGFRPTKPGSSPGAGHSIHSKTTKPKA